MSFAVAAAWSVATLAQDAPPGPEAAVQATPPVILARDTPVVLMAINEVSTADAKPGTVFKLRVHQPVSVAGRIVVPVGTQATGEVMSARDSGGLGKSGRMKARLIEIRLGEARIPLEGAMNANGTGAGSAGAAILLTGVVGLFHRGNNAKIKAGELISGYIAEDVALDLSGDLARRVELPAPAAPAQP